MKIARHPIRARQIEIGFAGVAEIIDAAVLEKTPNDTDHPDVFAQPLDFRAETANAADDEIDLHSGARSFVELFDDLVVDERVELGDDPPGLTRGGEVALALDQADQPRLQVERCDEKFFESGITGQTG